MEGLGDARIRDGRGQALGGRRLGLRLARCGLRRPDAAARWGRAARSGGSGSKSGSIIVEGDRIEVDLSVLDRLLPERDLGLVEGDGLADGLGDLGEVEHVVVLGQRRGGPRRTTSALAI